MAVKPCLRQLKSQSPQAGQFNSYKSRGISLSRGYSIVSIPSSGSIQFLPDLETLEKQEKPEIESQSPQAGQFNSYKFIFIVLNVIF